MNNGEAGLNGTQKKIIHDLLISDIELSGNTTLGDVIKRKLGLSDEEYDRLKDEIEIYTVSFYDNLLKEV